MTHLPLACVRWNDAHGSAMTIYEAHEVPHAPAVVRTFGVVGKQDEVGSTIASELFEAGSFRGATFIPKGMILDVVEYHAVNGTKPRRRAPKTPVPTPRPPLVPDDQS